MAEVPRRIRGTRGDYRSRFGIRRPARHANAERVRGLFASWLVFQRDRPHRARNGRRIFSPPAIDLLADATLTDLPFESLAKQAMREVLIVGRYGLLCDYSDEEARPCVGL
jgi:hypothetical protein